MLNRTGHKNSLNTDVEISYSQKEQLSTLGCFTLSIQTLFLRALGHEVGQTGEQRMCQTLEYDQAEDILNLQRLSENWRNWSADGVLEEHQKCRSEKQYKEVSDNC